MTARIHFSADPPNPLWATVVCHRRAPVERHTRDAVQVTCKRCVAWLAQNAERALGAGRRCLNCSGHGVVETRDGGSGYPKGGMRQVVKACPVCGGSGFARG